MSVKSKKLCQSVRVLKALKKFTNCLKCFWVTLFQLEFVFFVFLNLLSTSSLNISVICTSWIFCFLLRLMFCDSWSGRMQYSRTLWHRFFWYKEQVHVSDSLFCIALKDWNLLRTHSNVWRHLYINAWQNRIENAFNCILPIHEMWLLELFTTYVLSQANKSLCDVVGETRQEEVQEATPTSATQQELLLTMMEHKVRKQGIKNTTFKKEMIFFDTAMQRYIENVMVGHYVTCGNLTFFKSHWPVTDKSTLNVLWPLPADDSVMEVN